MIFDGIQIKSFFFSLFLFVFCFLCTESRSNIGLTESQCNSRDREAERQTKNMFAVISNEHINHNKCNY